MFVAGLGRNFNMMDLNKSYLLDKELGFGTKYIHPQLRISYPTLPLIAMKKKCAGAAVRGIACALCCINESEGKAVSDWLM